MSATDHIAWAIYCRETAGDLDVRDSFEQLSDRVKEIYRKKAIEVAFQEDGE